MLWMPRFALIGDLLGDDSTLGKILSPVDILNEHGQKWSSVVPQTLHKSCFALSVSITALRNIGNWDWLNDRGILNNLVMLEE